VINPPFATEHQLGGALVLYLPLAMELANERAREAERLARAAAFRRAGETGSPVGPRRPNRARALAALPVRAFSDASHALSEVACSAATRIEGTAR
jgi:hypothetical protein